jgi:hypothetical protein
MTDNEKIAQWSKLGNWLDYCGKDQDAVLLLPILVERNITFKILGTPKNYYMEISQGLGYEPMISVKFKPTIAAAISEAVLQLIDNNP